MENFLENTYRMQKCLKSRYDALFRKIVFNRCCCYSHSWITKTEVINYQLISNNK